MASESSPHNACSQIIFNLKTSKLNYVVKETPYSAYITIRKKFIRSVESNQEPLEFDDKTNQVKEAVKEVESLKQKNNDLGCQIALSNVEMGELEVKYEALERENIKLEDKIEEKYAENRNLKENLESCLKSNSELKAKYAEVCKSKDKISKDLENHKIIEKKKLNEKCDLVDILENTLNNKKLEIERLRQELEHTNTELKLREDKTKDVWQYPCTNCDFVISNEKDLKKHIETVHEHKCEDCDLVVKTKEKLKNHICKLFLKNPSNKNLYLKNWIVNKSCSTVFCNNKRKECAVLHSDECFLLNPRTSICQDLPGEYFIGTPVTTDPDGVFHLQLTKYIQNGEVKWPQLRKEMTLNF